LRQRSFSKAFSSGEGEPLAVDEEGIFLNCTNGDLLIRHGKAVPPSPLGKANLNFFFCLLNEAS